MALKVRIGVALGGGAAISLDEYGRVLDDLDRLGFDSVWLPETFLAGTLDPLVGLSFAAGRVTRLKLGTHLVAPGRNPYALAKALAQLDRLSGGRLLLTFVAGLDDPAERQAQQLPTGNRTAWFDEQLPRVRRWWSGEEVDGLVLDARPLQQPLEVWLGGRAPAALARAGRIGDGWLPGAVTIAEAVAGRDAVDAAAAEAGRTVSREHFGINISYTFAPTLPELPARRGAGDTSEVVVADAGGGALRELLGRWIAAGFSKIVVRPLLPPADWRAELEALAATVLDLQT